MLLTSRFVDTEPDDFDPLRAGVPFQLGFCQMQRGKKRALFEVHEKTKWKRLKHLLVWHDLRNVIRC